MRAVMAMNRYKRWRKPLLTTHVAIAVSWLGASLALSLLGIAGAAGVDPASVYPAGRLIAAWLVAPLAVLALGTGLLQAFLSPVGLTKYWWVTIKLAITVVLAGLVLFVLVPELGAAADAVTGPHPPGLNTIDRIRAAAGPLLASALLITNATLGIYKPPWRLPHTRHTPGEPQAHATAVPDRASPDRHGAVASAAQPRRLP
jgi:hypothetical protein